MALTKGILKQMSRNLYPILASICHLMLLPGNVHSWPQPCSKDAECSTPNSYCLDGLCEHCIPCQNFGRHQQPFAPGSCAKKEGDCGPCIFGHKAEENTGMRLAFRCEKLDELPAAPPQSLILLENSTFIPLFIAISISMLVAFTVTLYFKRRKLPEKALLESSHPTLENATEEMESTLHGPASNPNRQDEDEPTQPLVPHGRENEERPTEHANHVEAQPFFTSSPGPYEGTMINLSEHRRQTNQSNQSELLSIPPSTTFPTSDDVAYSIDVDPYDTQDGSGNSTGERRFLEAFLSFFVSIKRVYNLDARKTRE